MDDDGVGSDDERYIAILSKLKDLEYTRDLVEKRIDERRFIPVKSAVMTWTVFDGAEPLSTDIYTNDLLDERPELKESFKFCLMRTSTGYTFLLDGMAEGDDVIVRIGTVPEWNAGVSAAVATLRPEAGQAHIIVPRLFDEAHEHAFGYTVEHHRGGALLDRATGLFASRRRPFRLLAGPGGMEHIL